MTPLATPPTQRPSELKLILNCLAAIRWRLWTVRLTERVTVALQWGAIVALPLTASRLLRAGIPWEDRPYLAAILALLPTFGGLWLLGLFGKQFRPITLGLSRSLISVTAALTIALSLAQLILTFMPQGAAIIPWWIPVAVISLFAALGVATVRMIDNKLAAIFVDQQVGLHERVATALEMLETPAESQLESSFRAPVIASAVAACQSVKDARVGYARLNSLIYASAALVAIAAVGLTLLTPLPARAQSTRKPIVIEVKKAKDLQQFLKEAEEKKLPNDKVTAEKLKPLQNAVNQLQNGNMSQIESNAVLNEAKEQMKRDMEAMKTSDKVQDMLRQMQEMKDLNRATEDLTNADAQKNAGAEAGGQENAAKEALKNAAEAMGNKLNAGQMNDGERKDLADKLQAAADKAGNDPQLQKNLQAAADAAKAGDGKKMADNMKAAGQRMAQQRADRQIAQDAINRAMDQIDRMQNQNPHQQAEMRNPGNPQGGDQQGQQNPGGGQQQPPQQGGGDQQAGGQDPGGQNGEEAGGNQAGNQMAGGAENGGAGGAPQNGPNEGSTMFESKGGPGGNLEGKIRGKESFVRIYDPTKIDSKGNQEKVGSVIQPLKGPAVGSMEVMGNADKNDPNIKTYQDVLPEARQQAMEELTRQEYPPQYQEMVRRFYER